MIYVENQQTSVEEQEIQEQTSESNQTNLVEKELADFR